MSLDVYLEQRGEHQAKHGSGIFVREEGHTKEITRAEWDERNPGREPCTVEQQEFSDEVYSGNITHNLGRMAAAADLYEALWRPDDHGLTHAWQLIEPLKSGLEKLRAEPESFAIHAPSNGWGSYQGLVDFTANYLRACEEHPQASVRVSR
jgi:hypothetical protein